MEVIPGWFHDGARDKLAELITQYEIKDVIEIGSFVGKSTAFFAEHCKYVYAVDPFVMWEEGRDNGDAQIFGEDFYLPFLQNMRDAGVLDKVFPVRMTSQKAAEEFFNTNVDLVYIDGAHDYENVLRDIENYRPLAKKIICGDDYDENWLGVKRAVDEVFGAKVEIADNLWYVIL